MDLSGRHLAAIIRWPPKGRSGNKLQGHARALSSAKPRPAWSLALCMSKGPAVPPGSILRLAQWQPPQHDPARLLGAADESAITATGV